MPKKRTHSEFVELFNSQEKSSEYILISKYIGHCKEITLLHSLCNKEWKTTPNKFIDRKDRCPVCSLNRKYTLEDVKKYIESDTNYTLLSKSYNGNKCKLDVLHRICNNKFCTSFHDFKNGNYRCPFCSKNRKKNIAEIKDEISKSFKGYEYKLLSTSYINNATKLKFLHKVCKNTFLATSKAFLTQGTRCPICALSNKRSKGEEKIKEYLDLHKIKYMEQVYFDDCKFINTLIFDFAIFIDDYEFLLEYDGNVHFLPVFGVTREKRLDRLEKQKARDLAKNEYCISNNIILYRIPYTLFDKLEEIMSALTHPIDSNIYKQNLLIAGNS